MAKVKDARGREPTYIVEGNRVTNQRTGRWVDMTAPWTMADLKRAQRSLVDGSA